MNNRTRVPLISALIVLSVVTLSNSKALAQDGAPSQPEVQSFEPVGTNQMVDLFTGDFTYNIPLFNLPGPDGGYPINLAYHSGIQMEQEASWVGLGWNINVGTINRQVRNLPDDFGGSEDDKITIKTDMKPNWTVGGKFGFDVEILGINKEALELEIGVTPSLRLYYNNYKGVGYTLAFGFSASSSTKELGLSGNLGYNLSLDSQSGIGNDFSVSLSQRLGMIERKDSWISGSISAGTGFNNRTGFNRSMSLGLGMSTGTALKLLKPKDLNGDGGGTYVERRPGSSFGSGLGFSDAPVSISTPNEMTGQNYTLAFGSGFNVFGLYTKGTITADYSISKLKYRNKEVVYKGIGYMYYQEGTGDNFELSDSHRSREVLVHKDSRRLGQPHKSYDIYSVTGQGIGNSFRPYRPEVSSNEVQKIDSKFYGIDGGLELAINFSPANFRAGFDLSGNYTRVSTDNWSDNHTNAAHRPAQNSSQSLSGATYFQNYGEHSSDDLTNDYGVSINTDLPIAYGLENDKGFYNVQNKDVDGNDILISNSRPNRKKRALGVEAFTNEQVLDVNGSDLVVNEFAVDYFDGLGSNDHANLISYNTVRSSRTQSHVAGYTTTNGSGLRYVYGLAAYNNKEKDVTFTVEEGTGMVGQTITDLDVVNVDGVDQVDYKKAATNKYYQSKEKSAYAHSYLLTSILGVDYVDIDNIPGPSEGDLGYWVKFNYRRVDAGMKWRSPYEGASYNQGYEKSFTDGSGQYSYGEKEIWYLATIESKTHVAEFTVKQRKDAKEPLKELNVIGGGSDIGGYYLLEKIDVYAKAERYPNGVFNSVAVPIKTCNFEYDYSLCQGIENNDGGSPTLPYEQENQGGKLTLKKFYFTYKGNQLGSTTPYSFEYYNDIGGQVINYSREAVDRWGVYQPEIYNTNIDYPYNDPYEHESYIAERARLWSMSAVNLPSGGRYEIEYESDSYGYVQDEVAMHMFKIASLRNHDTYTNNNDQGQGVINHHKNDSGSLRKIYFKLETGIDVNVPNAISEVEKYIKKDEYLYFKVAINVTKDPDSKEIVAGYARVASVNVDPTSVAYGKYRWGVIELASLKVDGKETKFHPFTEMGARHIKFNHPDVLYNSMAANNADKEELSKGDVKNLGNSLAANGIDIIDLFKDYTATLTGNDNDKRLSEIDLERSWIRLRTPDKIKYGGGHRVKQITVTDNWADAFLTSGEDNSSYGTVYDYNLYDEQGNVIGSSGVASYEPMIGGDENPLRKPVEGWEDKNIASKNEAQTYSEEPGNESLFPSPQIGYSKVRVMSLNTAKKLEGFNIINYTGITEHDFYTAKDYPVYQDVTELEAGKSFRKSRLIVPALIVNIDRLRMAASQGYYIELNDMHGKPRGGREIGFTDQGDQVEISSVTYDYADKQSYTWNDAGEKLLTRRLDNRADVVLRDINPFNLEKSDIQERDLATTVEFVPETRYHESKNINTGFRMNFETWGIIPAFFPFPHFNWSSTRTGTVVTNKIVHKAGIMKKTTAITRGSKVETENLAFDQYTGQPLLSIVSNNFEDTVFNYSIKGYDVYEGMGPAYKNIGMLATGSAVSGSYDDGVQKFSITTDPGLFPGDELLARPILSGGETDASRSKFICHYIQKTSLGDYLFETKAPILNTELYEFMIIRSGRRNMLGTAVSSITALKNPTVDRTETTCLDIRDKSSLNVPVLSIDSVLSISAVELGNKWYKNTREISEVPSNWYDNAFYSKGMSGVYSGVRNYAYIDDRIQSETSGKTDVDLRRDGVMNNVPLFNWDYILSTGVGCPENWREVDHVTLKNPSSATIETKNVIGTYSTSLYGKSGTEPIAMAGNAKNTEIGFESFEEYENGVLRVSENATNNLNFYTSDDVSPMKLEDRYDIRDGLGGFAVIDEDIALLSSYNSQAVIRIHYDGFNSEAQERIVRFTPVLNGMSNGATSINITSIYADLDVSDYVTRRWRGEIFFEKTVPAFPESNNAWVKVTDVVAHTGKKSLEVTSVQGSDFLQGRLVMQPGEKYQFSGWFSSPENIHLLLNNSNLLYSKMKLDFLDMYGAVVSSKEYEEKDILIGSFIEDWQKFTVDFTMPTGAYYVRVKLPTAMEVFDNEAGDWVQKAFYDDLRIQPLDGGMQCYVYNQEDQRLEATLDGNNYATFYYYNDEGQLFLVKRETEEGVITVQESRAYMKRNEP